MKLNIFTTSAAVALLSSSFAASVVNAQQSNDLCYGKTQAETEIDLYNSVVSESTLHQPGGRLVYENVGVVRDKPVNLVVSIYDGDYTTSKPEKNGKGSDANGEEGKGMFGNINLQTKKNDFLSGEGNFEFCFHDKETDELVTVDSFQWSIYDLDERNAEPKGIKEKFIMDTKQAQDYVLWPNTEESEVKLFCENFHLWPYTSASQVNQLPCNEGERIIFHSSTQGVGSDNPKDKDDMTDLQKSRSVQFTFVNTSCWRFTYNHYCPPDEVGDSKECVWYGGGNFLFAGSAKQLIEEGECITDSPTQTPTEVPSASPTVFPTESPTQAPTKSPTELPTASPTKTPTASPTTSPTKTPTASPSASPTKNPTASPTQSPTKSPTQSPTAGPTKNPTAAPTMSPTKSPTTSPSSSPSVSSSESPSASHTDSPTVSPSISPTKSPTVSPTDSPTKSPTQSPTTSPTKAPTNAPTTSPTESMMPTDCSEPAPPKVIDSVCMTTDGDLMDTIPLPENAIEVWNQSGDSSLEFTVTQAWKDEAGLAVQNGFDECVVKGNLTLGSSEDFLGECPSGVTSVTIVVYLDDYFDPDECEACNVDDIDDMGGDYEFCAYRVEIPCDSVPVECGEPTAAPSALPSSTPSTTHSRTPTASPSDSPSSSPTKAPTASPTISPTKAPTNAPTDSPSASPSGSFYPSSAPSDSPTESMYPSSSPTDVPTKAPTPGPTMNPTQSPTVSPTVSPTEAPTKEPTASPTKQPTASPTSSPTASPSASPTKSPTVSPTKSPTTSPTASLTKAPTVEPTLSPTVKVTTQPPIDTNGGDDDDDDMFFEPTCPEDVELVDHKGQTDIDLDRVVKIVSQDTSTVKVSLNQGWDQLGDEDIPIDHIYYSFRPDTFNEKCYEETSVMENAVFDTVTIQCHVYKPYALLEICLVDDLKNELLTVEDNATVPKCCHPTFPPETPTVCYTIKINCVTECVEENNDNNNDVERRGLRGSY